MSQRNVWKVYRRTGDFTIVSMGVRNWSEGNVDPFLPVVGIGELLYS